MNPSANTLSSISGFLRHIGCQSCILDLNRRVSPLTPEVFEGFENGQIPYPLPLQRKANFAILLWSEDQPEQHQIWCLSFPLDEHGCMQPNERDGFLHQLLNQLGTSLQAIAEGEHTQDQMNESKWGIRPSEPVLAMIHAHFGKALNMEASPAMKQVEDFILNNSGDWQFLPFQGFADFALKSEADYAEKIDQLKVEPLSALCQCLEHCDLNDDLVEALIRRIRKSIKQSQQQEFIPMLLRAISASQSATSVAARQKLISQLLQQAEVSTELLIVIASRCFEDLKQIEVAQAWLEAMANHSESARLFSPLLAETMAIPGVRAPLMQVLRSTERSDSLSKATGEFFAMQMASLQANGAKH
ncbi:DUF3549 family protein [Pelagibaculum spongiae]|uniref:DUF3549 domain-containing protein n=1 Tax=Pelagibaculum spongiae TaxID=2080658 RepID=A0A2V1GW00_9GAMM|nr:DUF3549 family protein [Pelagibaculum spongiae]PVZ69504.1 hypothetical protein DC094_09245 [Pelagibaculum spongiae]